MRRLAVASTLAALAVASCRGGQSDGPEPRRSVPIARPLEVYQQLGMLAGSADFPAVARFAMLAGAGDSTLVLLSISLPNSAVRFQRDESGFNAEYRVSAMITRDSVQVSQIDRRETVRVGSFAETGREEESVVFQDMLPLLPGTYIVHLQIADANSSRGLRAIDTVDVPTYRRDGKLAPPLLVYEGAGRARVSDRPDIILNPRNTIPYGAESAQIYLEQYGAEKEQPVSLRIVDEAGALIWSAQPVLAQGTSELRHAVVPVPAATLPIGRLWLEALEPQGVRPQRAPLLVLISEQWMVANFDDVLRFLALIAYPAEIDSLRKATGAERQARWERFWTVRDPLPATPVNEFREQFFERIRIASHQFNESGQPGWETDRGEVYVVLGPPDQVVERHIGRNITTQSTLVEWLYESLPGGRLVLQFIDRSGFGRYELTQSSESAFRILAARMRPRA